MRPRCLTSATPDQYANAFWKESRKLRCQGLHRTGTPIANHGGLFEFARQRPSRFGKSFEQSDMKAHNDVKIHESAYVAEGAVLGEGTRVWHFCPPSAVLDTGTRCVF